MSYVRVGIDARGIKPFPTGIGSHFLNLMRWYIIQSPKREFIILVHPGNEAYIKEAFHRLPVIYKQIPVRGGSFKQYILFPWLYMVFRSLHLTLLITDPWSSFWGMPGIYVLMVYDLIGFHHVVKLSLKQRLYDRFMFKHAARQASRVVASSQAVYDDIYTFFNVARWKISIVRPSVAKEYEENLSDESVRHVQEKYGLKNRYFIYVGNRRPHKNLLGALSMYQLFLDKYGENDIDFVLIGSFDTEKKTDGYLQNALDKDFTNIKDHIRLLGRIDDNETVCALLKGSIALLHPTLFEGFGLTPLEAMHAGTPVISTTIPVVREIVCNAGILHDPRDIESHAQAMLAFAQNEAMRHEYIEKGYVQAATITWKKAGKGVNKVVSSCLKEHSSI